MAGEFDFENHEHGRGQQEQYCGVADGKQVEREDGEENHHRSQRAGDDGAGDVEFEVDEQGSADQQHEGEVGVGEAAEKLLAEGGFESDDAGVAQMEGFGVSLAVDACDGAAVERGDELSFVGGGQVDEVLGESFVVGEGFGFADGGLGELHVAAAAGDIGAQKGGCVVLHLLLHGVVGRA